jgi:hypothetical protein
MAVPVANAAVSRREATRPVWLELMDCARLGGSLEHS